MKALMKWVIVTALALSVSAISVTAEAGYRCKWKHGDRVCRYTSCGPECRWVPPNWENGFAPTHKECR